MKSGIRNLSPLQHLDVVIEGKTYPGIREAVLYSLAQVEGRRIEHGELIDLGYFYRLCRSRIDEMEIPGNNRVIYSHMMGTIYVYLATCAMVTQHPEMVHHIIEHGRDYTFMNSVCDTLFGRMTRMYPDCEFKKRIYGSDMYGCAIRYIARSQRGERFPEVAYKSSRAAMSDPRFRNWQELGERMSKEVPWNLINECLSFSIYGSQHKEENNNKREEPDEYY